MTESQPSTTMGPLDDAQVAALAEQVSHRLAALATGQPALLRAPGDELGPEREAIEQATGEPSRRFMGRFLGEARRDLCEEGGLLYGQWKKWGRLDNPAVVRQFAALLAGMGIGGALVPVLVVPVVVIVLHLGVRTVCAELADTH